MGAERGKQRLKNAVYRTIGETSALLGAGRWGADRTLRVLMYHKVNDRPGNPMSVPPALFADQLAQLGELGYGVVTLEAVLDHFHGRQQLPPRAVLLTFDDGYRDNLEHALPALEAHGYGAVVFVPTGFVGETRPLPHDEGPAARGIQNPALDWGELRELERVGMRIESHGISHRPLSGLAPAEAEHEIVESKRRLEEQLGRAVEAFAFVKGSAAHFGEVHVEMLRSAGYRLGFTTRSGANGPQANPLRLRRYNVEPFPPRTFELLLSGACDPIALKDTVAGTQARRALNAVLGTSSR